MTRTYESIGSAFRLMTTEGLNLHRVQLQARLGPSRWRTMGTYASTGHAIAAADLASQTSVTRWHGLFTPSVKRT